MAGFLMTAGATSTCAHGGSAQATAPYPRVTLGGQPVVCISSSYVVAGCPFVAGVTPMPCVTAQFIVGATRVLAGGQPVVLAASPSICAPNGTPLIVMATQSRVSG